MKTMERFPKVSVVIPTYNRARYVTEAIDSVLAQTVPPDEIIVVDDGSTDNTQDVLKRFGDRIKYIRQDNAGPGIARNTGIKSSKNEYIAFLDSDDLWEPNRLERQLAAAKRYRHRPVLWFSDAKFVLPDVQVRASEWEIHGRFRPERAIGILEKPNEFVVKGYIINTSTILANRKALLQVGLFEPKRESEDGGLWVRLGRIGSFGYIAESLCVRRMVGEHTNFHSVRAYREQIRVLSDLAMDADLSDKARAIAFRRMVRAVKCASGALRRAGRNTEARRQLRVIRGWWYRPSLMSRYFLNLLRKDQPQRSV